MNYVKQAFETNWVVPLGPNVDEFERRLATFLGGGKTVVALSAGTAAIHLGLVMAGVKAGDEVVCQSLTFSASANPVVYLGAKPIFVDSEPETWNMDPDILAETLDDRKRLTGRYPSAVVPVHLYGMPAKMNEILKVCSERGIPVVEDAAEALGSRYDGRCCGTLGNYGALSFNGNKIITTSGGGALVCPDAEAAARVKFLATQAREPKPYYYHLTIGYNYRLSNVSAGIGCGQMEVLDEHLERRRYNHNFYVYNLKDIDGLSVLCNPSDKYDSNFWLTTILLDKNKINLEPDFVRTELEKRNIESRLIWRPMHMQPVFADAPYYGGEVSRDIFESGLCLPSSSSLTDYDLQRVVDGLHDIIRNNKN